MILRFFKITSLFIIFFFGHFSIFGQGIQQTEYNILGVSVAGNITAESQTIIALSGLFPGDVIKYPGDSDKFQTAIKNL